jgi:hypothetical protein
LRVAAPVFEASRRRLVGGIARLRQRIDQRAFAPAR